MTDGKRHPSSMGKKRMTRRNFIAGAAAGSAALSLAGASSPAVAKKVTWQIQSMVPESDADWFVTLKRMKQIIEDASDGAVAVEIFPVGAMVEPDSIVSSVASGAIEGGHIIAGMAADRVPTALGTEMPYGVNSSKQHHELHFDEGLIDIMRKEYAAANIELVGIGTSGQLALMSKKPINGTADLDGMKIWAIPNAGWLANFGAAPTEVPGFDMYSAMRLGTIDAFTWTMGELEFGNLKEVVGHVMQPRILTPGTHLIINKASWESIPQVTRTKIEDDLQAAHLDISRAYEEIDAKSISAAKKYGVKFNTISDDDLRKMQKEAESFWNEVEGASPAAKEMVNKYRTYLKKLVAK